MGQGAVEGPPSNTKCFRSFPHHETMVYFSCLHQGCKKSRIDTDKRLELKVNEDRIERRAACI